MGADVEVVRPIVARAVLVRLGAGEARMRLNKEMMIVVRTAGEKNELHDDSVAILLLVDVSVAVFKLRVLWRR